MSRRDLIAAAAILLLATYFRFHQLETQSFWNDEGNSARLSERPVAQIIEGTASDVHPPLYYLALRAWREGAGESEFGLRAFSALAGILTVATTMALGLALSRSSLVALFAGLFAAASPVLVYYAQETRMYAQLALLAVLSTWVLWVWVVNRGPAEPPRHGTWVAAYALLIVAGLYTHYFFPTIILAHGTLLSLYWLLPQTTGASGATTRAERLKPVLWWLAAVTVAALAYAVWLPIFLRQVGGRAGTATELLTYLTGSGTWLSAGTTLPQPAANWTLWAGLVLVALGILAGWRRSVVPLVMAGLPLAASYVTGATDPAFFKFLLTAVPFLCVLAAFAWRWPGRMRALPAALTAVLLAGSILSLANMYDNPVYARADYRAMAARIDGEAHPNAAVILNAPNQWEAFTYYYKGDAPVFPLPKGQPDPSVLEPELAAIAANTDRIYALFWGDAQRDPQRVVEQWLDANAFKATEEWVSDVRFVVYAVPGEQPDTLQAGYPFRTPDGATIALAAYGFGPDTLLPGDILQLRLVWTADAPIDRAYKVFVHLVDEDGVLIAQRDSEPAGGSRPTTAWQAGEAVEDNHGLLVPPWTEPGQYRLLVGLYDALDPAARLPVTVGEQQSDAVQLGSFTIP